ncbi:hypothetical protein [Anaerovibrio sp.]|uniref:hypothetical protein n=1 Tax=Anaerovibrio sp. TaxID=1872532 RepID=UPI003F159211
MVSRGKTEIKAPEMAFKEVRNVKETEEQGEGTAIRVNVDIFTDSMYFSELRMQNYLRKRGNVLQCNRMHSRCSYWLEMEVREGEQVDPFLRRMKRYVPGIVDWKIGFIGHRLL